MKTTSNSYQNPELRAYFVQKIEENKQHLIIDGRNDGAHNIPSLTNKNLKPIFQKNHLLYQLLINYLAVEIPIQATIDEVVESKRVTEEKKHRISNQISDLKTQRVAIDAKLKGRQRPFSHLRVRLVWGAIICVALYESISTSQVYQTLGFGPLASAAMSIFFAVILVALPFIFKKTIERCKTLWQKRLTVGGLFIFLTALFVYMGHQRAELRSKQIAAESGGTIIMHFDSLVFVLSSLFFVIMAIAIHYLLFPSDEQWKARDAYRQMLEEKDANQRAQEDLAVQIAQLDDDYEALKTFNTSKLAFGAEMEELIITHAHEGFEEWKKQDLSFRPDRGRPLSFDIEGYPCQFKTNFGIINRLKP